MPGAEPGRNRGNLRRRLLGIRPLRLTAARRCLSAGRMFRLPRTTLWLPEARGPEQHCRSGVQAASPAGFNPGASGADSRRLWQSAARETDKLLSATGQIPAEVAAWAEPVFKKLNTYAMLYLK